MCLQVAFSGPSLAPTQPGAAVNDVGGKWLIDLKGEGRMLSWEGPTSETPEDYPSLPQQEC